MKLPKLMKWEFWPFWFFYIPVYVKYIWLGIRARSFVFFSAANPTMELGGFSAYSKFKILESIPSEFKPLTLLISQNNKGSEVESLMLKHQLDFPIILKPDVGERGFDVAKIENKEELLAYFNKSLTSDIILQEYANYPIEVGVMYHRIPGQQTGKITSVVIKDFLSIEGDGKSTYEQLFKNGKRTRFYLDMLYNKYRTRLQDIPKKGETIELESIGNHCRGTTFLDGSHLINEQLLAVFDRISLQMKDHFFGRFDIRVPSYDNLYAGNNIKIMEVNGANSEPAHIYDPEMPLLKAYGVMFRHWQNLYDVSIANHKLGIEYTPLSQAIKKIRIHLRNKKQR